MQVETKQIILDMPKALTVDYIENYIKNFGYKPLRWAIVKSENSKLTMDIVVIID